MKQRFTDEQIIKILQEAKGRLTVKAVCRKYAIAEARNQTTVRRRT